MKKILQLGLTHFQNMLLEQSFRFTKVFHNFVLMDDRRRQNPTRFHSSTSRVFDERSTTVSLIDSKVSDLPFTILNKKD
jgi:hypothetical protein